MDPRASVANKRLTARLNPLDATLTKNRGGGRGSRLRRSGDPPIPIFVRDERRRGNPFASPMAYVSAEEHDGMTSLLLFGVTSLHPHYFFALNCRLSTLDFPLFEYRIGAKPHDRPAPIGSLQKRNAANSRRFRIALICCVESRRQTCYRTARRAPGRLSGSTLGSSPEARRAADLGTTTANRSSRARARSKYASPSCHRCGAWHRRRRGDGQAVVIERFFHPQPPHWRKHPRTTRSLTGRLPFTGQQLLGLRAKIPVRQLQARIPHRPGQVEKRLRLPQSETSHGRQSLQPHGFRSAQNYQSSRQWRLGARKYRPGLRPAPAAGHRNKSRRQKNSRREDRVICKFPTASPLCIPESKSDKPSRSIEF